MDALTLLNSEPDLQSFKELFEEWWIDYEFDQRINVLLGQYPYTNFEERIDYGLKEEYGTSSRKVISSRNPFIRKEIKQYRLTSSKVDHTNKEGVLLWKKFWRMVNFIL